MCLLFFNINDNCNSDELRLVLVNNRDEFWQRPSKTADFWTINRSCISGLDEEPGREGGTWLGASRHGRIACLVNISQRQDQNKKGRGFLVTNFLTTSESIESYAERIVSERDDYNGFILTLIELGRTGSKVARVTNDTVTNTPLLFMHPSSNDWYSLGNSSVEVCWQKVGEGEARFRSFVETYRPVTSRDTLTDNLLNMMADSTRFLPDPVLQKAGEDCGWSQESTDSKAALFVWDPLHQYGTRTTTVLTVDGSGNCDYTEKTLQQPEKTLQQPEKTLQQPEKTLQRPENSSPLPLSAVSLQWSTVHYRYQLEPSSSL